MKRISVILAAGMILLSFACNNKKEDKTEDKTHEKMVEETPAIAPVTAFEPFKVVAVQHKVAKFDAWRTAYNAHDSMQHAYGLTPYGLGRGLEDSNMVYAVLKMDDVQKAKEFSKLPNLKEVMKKAGVTGPPVFHYINVIRDDNSKIDYSDRVMVMHKVKDFDAWLKVYDGEGMEARKANGLLDRGLGRDVDDPNMVYIVFAITDMTKAKARMNSPELKKLMTDAGVEGKPTFNFFRIVN